MLKRLFLTLSLLFCAIPVLAMPCTSTCYVNTGGTSTECTSWTDACGQGTTAESLIQRDGTIWVGSGSYSAVTLNVATDGVRVITIKHATIAAHGTPTGWSDSFATGSFTFRTLTIGSDYWTIDGVTGGGPGQWDSGFGCTFNIPSSDAANFQTIYQDVSPGTTTGLTVRHCSFAETGNYSQYGEGYGMIPFYFPGAVHKFLLEYNSFNNLSGGPFLLDHGEDITIQYSHIGRETCGMALKAVGSHCENLVSHSLDLRFRWNWMSSAPSTGGIVKNACNESYCNEHMLWKIYGNLFVGLNNISTCNPDCYGEPIIHNALGGQTPPDGCDRPIIVQNTFVHYANHMYASDCNTPIQYNNISFLSEAFKGSQSYPNPSSPPPLARDYNYISNDLFAQAHGNEVDDATAFGPHENAYSYATPPGHAYIGETNDPFVNSSDYTSILNFLLSTPIPASIWVQVPPMSSVGVDICTIVTCTADDPYNVDMFGHTFGADGTWDRGFAEFQESPPPPSIDGSLRARMHR